MRTFVIILMLLSLASCGWARQEFKGNDGFASPSCVVSKIDKTTTITCPDGSSQTIYDGESAVGSAGPSGPSGAPGIAGSNGHSMVFNTLSASNSDCSNGGSIILLAIDSNDNNILDVDDSNLQSAVVCNGEVGATGAQGIPGQAAPPTSFTPVAIIDPCSDSAGIVDEVFIKLANGLLLASFSDNVSGLNTRFSVIPSWKFSN